MTTEIDISQFIKPLVHKKVGYVALIGRPNSGKSTFINALIDEKVSAVSSKPQTTQKTIRGIYNDDDSQIIFFDTPGIHESKEELNIIINSQAATALNDADIIVRFIDISRQRGEEEEKISELLKGVKKPVILVYSKCDLKHATEARKDAISISSRNKNGFRELLSTLKKSLPTGPLFYDEDYYTDQDMETRIREIIREKIFLSLGEELPYDILVDVEDLVEENGMIKALVMLYVSKDSQKNILIGKQGVVLQNIGKLARIELEKILDRKVYILLRVKTMSKWNKNPNVLKKYFG
ncbi:MAG: GTPase Era [Candidatus Gracilibacteria bacterium]